MINLGHEFKELPTNFPKETEDRLTYKQWVCSICGWGPHFATDNASYINRMRNYPSCNDMVVKFVIES